MFYEKLVSGDDFESNKFGKHFILCYFPEHL